MIRASALQPEDQGSIPLSSDTKSLKNY